MIGAMTTVIHGENLELEALLERRRALGQDGSDEIWEGVYHVVPHANSRHALVQIEVTSELRRLVKWNGYRVTGEFNLGEPDDFRVPDFGVHSGVVTDLYLPTALAVGEVLSPQDSTYEKFGFYHSRGVQEILVTDPIRRTVQCWLRGPDRYTESDTVECARISTEDLAKLIDWP
jgi:hypothetical protein